MRNAIIRGGLGMFAVGFSIWVSAAAAHAQGAAKVDAVEAYKTKCLVCHQADGNSQIMPNMSFADGIWKQGSTIKEVSATITNGVPGTAMMPFKEQLSPAEIAALARYVRQFDKKLKGAK